MTKLIDLILQDSNLEAIQKAIEEGENVNEIDEHGWSPLQTAIGQYRFDVCKLLYDYGADIKHKNGKDQDMFYFLCDAAEKKEETINYFRGANRVLCGLLGRYHVNY